MMKIFLLEAFRPRLRRLGQAAKSDERVLHALRRAAARRTVRRHEKRAASIEKKMAFKTPQEVRSLKIHRSHSQKVSQRAAALLRALRRRKNETMSPDRRKRLSKLARYARAHGQALTRHRTGSGWKLGLTLPKDYPSDRFRPTKGARAASIYSKRRYTTAGAKKEDEKLKQKKMIPARIRKAARIIHKFGMKKGYFPNL